MGFTEDEWRRMTELGREQALLDAAHTEQARLDAAHQKEEEAAWEKHVFPVSKNAAPAFAKQQEEITIFLEKSKITALSSEVNNAVLRAER